MKIIIYTKLLIYSNSFSYKQLLRKKLTLLDQSVTKVAFLPKYIPGMKEAKSVPSPGEVYWILQNVPNGP